MKCNLRVAPSEAYVVLDALRNEHDRLERMINYCDGRDPCLALSYIDQKKILDRTIIRVQEILKDCDTVEVVILSPEEEAGLSQSRHADPELLRMMGD